MRALVLALVLIAGPALAQDGAPLPTATTELRGLAQDEAAAAAQVLLEADRAFALEVLSLGPEGAYAAAMAPDGVIVDASGPSTPGPDAAKERFGAMPSDARVRRTPEGAQGDRNQGATWGSYALERGTGVVALGRYVTLWRREGETWRIVNELAAGRAAPPSGVAAFTLPPQNQTDPNWRNPSGIR